MGDEKTSRFAQRIVAVSPFYQYRRRTHWVSESGTAYHFQDLGIFVKSFINRYTTPLTTGLFAVSAISGIALFFHWAPSAFHSMHEWLSIGLLLPFVLHVWKNWAAFVGYFRRGTLIVPIALSLAVAIPFAVPALTGSGGGGNPAFKAVTLMTETTLKDLAPILKTTPDALLASLTQQGYAVGTTDLTLTAMAHSAGKDPNALLFSLMTEN